MRVEEWASRRRRETTYPLAAFATRLEATGAIGKAASRLWARN
jgi:hypothetical protein